MNPWKTLNIDPTDDKKLIKKAYAVLIKQYKPDEHPEKFKEIQAAYKTALAMRQWQVEEMPNNEGEVTESQPNDSDIKFPDETNDEKNTGSENQYKNHDRNDFVLSEAQVDESDLEFKSQHEQESSNEFSLSKAPVYKKELELQQIQQNIIDELYKQIHAMAFAPLVIKNKRNNWNFIENFYKIDDIVLKSEVAIEVFNKVAEYNLFQLQKNGTLLINKEVVKYFNKIFDWSHEWKAYQSIFPDNRYLVNFQFIDASENKKVKQKSLLSLRVGAFVVDFLSVVFILVIMRVIQFSLDITWFEGTIFAWIFLAMVIVSRLLFEIKSKNKRSLGKTSNNLIIVDEYGNFCSIKQTFLRHFILITQILFVFVVPMFINKYWNSEDVFLIALCLFIIVNLGLYAFTKKMLHDYFSRTQIIKQLIVKKVS
jgi:hypothetical protein